MDAQQLAEVSVWVDQYAEARERLDEATAATARAAWASFTGWYDLQLVAEVAAQVADLSRTAQDAAVGASTQYVAQVVAALRQSKAEAPPIDIPPVRNGADPLRVATRPAEVFRDAYATGHSEAEALDRALDRAQALVETDIMLAGRSAQRAQMKALDVRGYRRVLHPELSKSGSCGLCVVASDRVYSVKDLLPIHAPSCKCETLPIVGENDPGRALNEADLEKLYEAAGSTSGDALKRLRVDITDDGAVEVRDHGEYGPTLTRAEDSFRGPKETALADDPERAARMLAKVLPVLDGLEQRAAAGEDVSGPLGYQRDLADRLRGITDAAA